MRKLVSKRLLFNHIQAVKYIIIGRISDQKIGEDKKYDRTIFHSAIKVTLGTIPNELQTEEVDPKLLKEIEQNDNLVNDSNIEQLRIANCKIVEAFNIAESKFEFDENPKMSFLFKSLFRTRGIHRHFKSLYHRKHIKRVQINRIELSSIIAFASILFLVAGILRAGMIAQSFGFHMDMVYGIGDYVQSSIVAISRVTVYTVLMIVLYFITHTEDTKLSDENRLNENKKSRRDGLLSLAAILVAAISYGIIIGEYFNIFTQLLAYFVILRFFSWATNRYLENSRGFVFGSFIAIVALSQVFIQTHIELDGIRSSSEARYYTVKYEDGQEIEGSIVVSTSRYLVFWDLQNEVCQIYSNSGIRNFGLPWKMLT